MAKSPIQALESIRRVVTVDWRKRSEEEARQLLIRTARQGHVRIMREQTARSGSVPIYKAWANSPANTNIATVKAPGPIVYEYYYSAEIVKEALKMLQDMSPVESGKYKRSHGLWIDGLPVKPDTPLSPEHEIFIANTVDYSRRLEVGKTTSGRQFTIQKKYSHIYERATKRLNAKYENVANIYFGYVQLPGAWEIKGRLPPHYMLPTGKKRKRRQNVGELVRAPAIFIEPYPQ